MKHTEHYKIKWHDTDANRMLQPSRLLAYMQETANLHLLASGMSLDTLRDEKALAFLLSRISIRIYVPLSAHDEIDVETWVCESRGLSFQRCFRILRGSTVAAEAFSVWGLLDLNEKKLLPATAFPYQIEPDPPLDPSFSARVRLPAIAQMECAGERRIVYSDIDYNGHMNNTHYPNMLCDFTPSIERLAVTAITLSFLREATYGHTLKIMRAPRENGYFFRTLDESGEVCLEATLTTEDVDAFGGAPSI
jgi:acyl-CoA thioesterase FadM